MADNDQISIVFEIRKIYLKDVSYESPQVPHIFTETDKVPTIDVQLRIDSNRLGDEGDFYEAVLVVTVTAKLEDDTVFLVEVQQAGIFQIAGVSEEEFSMALEIACPNVLLPYAREAISDLVAKGGFPQLLINPVNFEALYQQKRQQQAESAPESAPEPATKTKKKATKGNGKKPASKAAAK